VRKQGQREGPSGGKEKLFGLDGKGGNKSTGGVR